MLLTATSIQAREQSPLLPARGSDVRPVIRQSIGGCGVEVPHVFDTTVMPPHPDKRCRCGKQTWKKAEAEMLARRLEEFAATEQRTSPSETVGRENAEAISAPSPRTNDVTRHPNAPHEPRRE
jgi:hypothetical protein